MELTKFEKKIEDFGLDIIKEFVSCKGRLNDRQLDEVECLAKTLNQMAEMAKSNRTYDSWVGLLQEELES